MEHDEKLFEKLEHAILKDKLYLQPGLKRADVDKLVHVPKNKFCKLFVQFTGYSFTQYINNKRLEYAAELLKKHPEYAIAAIAKECGLPATQSFYRNFRRKFKMTPAQYKLSSDSMTTIAKQED